ncbi:crossover junction endonuclease EME1 [Astyanax mexicanus]|uniref:crossover junction endonuclease EME1 n=1 Tax=Astyanax mexicanus TaxID=7994 RepID=UPI0020CAAE5B|nr:crossover junction endonuclease EME1 [Astyanax mexicanus]XP_049320603.1 crossover junction endonuclease EME1 [Astyanax mexicanus]
MMGSNSRPCLQFSDTDSSDSEELPFINFSQRGNAQDKTKSSKCDLVVVDGSEADSDSWTKSAVPAVAGSGAVMKSDVHMVSSSESEEEEEAFIPLAVRLKQKQSDVSKAQTSLANHIAANHNGNLTTAKPSPALSAHRVPETGPAADYLGKYSSNISHQSGNYDAACVTKDLLSGGENPRKGKRTPAEMEAAKEDALRRRAAREKQQGERERLRAEKKAMADAVKAMRPEECLKHMAVAVDPGLLQLEGGGALLTSLHAMGCSCAIEKQPLPRSVSWLRRAPCPQTGELVSIPESHTVIQVPVEDFITMIHSYTQEQRGGGSAACGISLTSWTLRLMARNPGRTLSLAVIDIEKYYKSQNARSRQKFREAVLGDGGGGGVKKRKRKEAEEHPDVSRVDVEEALVDLQLHAGVQVHFHSTWKDFTDYVTMSTKAVAEAPFKRERDKTGFGFCLESEWAGGQKVDRTGKGLLQVWKRQIQQLNRVSPDMASAVLNAYPSPQLLIQAYRQCKSEREKVTLLSDVLIRRGEGVTSTTRRVGPELSKRLFLLMNSVDPQQTLDAVA